ncbi:MAG: hypothetical protein M3077_14735 [Candidatus Dormibacteraeota bacterium]|nr:hypothetical protein [Candidatus Dormibacteraeota bacterium]
MTERNLIARALFVFIPVMIAASIVMALVLAAVQQDLRMGANDPQIQMAEDFAARLDSGASPASVAPASPVDLARSLAPFVIIFGRDRRPLASSASLDGQTPRPPAGVFDAVTKSRRSEITWAPRPEVREAAVIVAYGDGYVLVGRSLRLVEQRADALAQVVILLFLVMLILTGLASLGTSWLWIRAERRV